MSARWLYGGVNGDLLQEGLCRARTAAARALALRQPTADFYPSAGDAQTLQGRSGSVSVETPSARKVLFESPEHL